MDTQGKIVLRLLALFLWLLALLAFGIVAASFYHSWLCAQTEFLRIEMNAEAVKAFERVVTEWIRR